MTPHRWLLLLVSLLLCAVLAAMVTAPVPEPRDWTPATAPGSQPAIYESETP